MESYSRREVVDSEKRNNDRGKTKLYDRILHAVWPVHANVDLFQVVFHVFHDHEDPQRISFILTLLDHLVLDNGGSKKKRSKSTNV